MNKNYITVIILLLLVVFFFIFTIINVGNGILVRPL
jgi:hypothetical protein